MGNAEVRAQIAQEVSTVSGVTGYVHRPSAVKVGDAWPQWRGGERVDGMGFMETWVVYVVVPGDEDSADDYADTIGYPVLQALRPVLYADAIVPAQIQTSAGPMLALMITGRSE
jgi:hypothetical protein